MPYDRNTDLPENVRNVLPEHAREMYRKAFNNAWDQYEDPAKRQAGRTREETAHAVAWSAVEHEYKKDVQRKWVKKNS